MIFNICEKKTHSLKQKSNCTHKYLILENMDALSNVS